MTTFPTAFLVESSQVSDKLPTTLDDVRSTLQLAEPPVKPKQPLTLFITVDVEDTYFDRPILMTGDGIGREFGVFGILDELDSHGVKGTFFVNVYETDRHPAGTVERVVREIYERGHEVGLHSHPTPDSKFFGRSLPQQTRLEQAGILAWGVELIDRWTGSPPISFRAGGYSLDDNTFTALEEVGMSIDSSCFFPSANNHQERFTVNAVAARGSVIEAPITTVLESAGDAVKHSKLDFNWLTVDQLLAALGVVADNGIGFATCMMHSFSFIEKATRRQGEPSAPAAIFTSEDAFGCYVDVLGPRPHLRAAFASFLERIAADPRLGVRTLADALPELRESAVTGSADLVPVVAGP
ncbi:MAG TPA: polysaccharide deacetylase family protein [Solirubrobacterales bacterium]|nr:polysaccharide deacetylase family protein [Solirubrobacterales bacterium]